MKKVFLILELLIIIIACIFTGNPVVKNDFIIIVLTAILGIMFGIFAIIKKEKIINNKIDLMILILCVSSILPILFNTYVSLSGSVYYIFRYFVILIIYFVTVYLKNNFVEFKEYITKILIFAGIIFLFFGIDLMTTGFSKNFVDFIIGSKTEQDYEIRMYSLFFYSNTLAVILSMSFLLSLGEVLKGKNKYVYNGFLTLLLAGILLTQSRAVIILLAIMLVLYLCLLNKEKRYIFIKNLFVSGIFSLIYVLLFNYCRQSGNGLFLWSGTFFIGIISGMISKLLFDFDKINKFINIKTLIVLVIVIIVFVIILMQFTIPLVLFNGNNAQLQVTKAIYDLEPNRNYNIQLELEAKSDTLQDNFLIEFIQINQYSDDISKYEFTVNNCNKEFCFDIKTSENISRIDFVITANETNENTKLIVKSLKIDGEEVVLDYKFLPTDLINKLLNLNLSNKSVWERTTFIKDGFKIGMQNILSGIGGDGWKYKQHEVQSYYYFASQMHCYVIQIFMEFGIVGIVSFLIIIFFTLINILKIFKNKDENEIPICIAFIISFLHSLIDFDMSFLCLMIIFFVFIGVINSKTEKDKKSKNIFPIILVIVSVIVLYFYIVEKYVELTNEKFISQTRTYEEKTDLENKYIKFVPYNSIYKLARIEYLDLYVDVKKDELSKNEISKLNKEKIELLKKCIETEKYNIINKCVAILKSNPSNEEKEYAYKKINDVFETHKYDSRAILNDYLCLYTLIDEDTKINNIIINNIDKDINYIRDYEKCRITKENSEEIISKIIRE